MGYSPLVSSGSPGFSGRILLRQIFIGTGNTAFSPNSLPYNCFSAPVRTSGEQPCVLIPQASNPQSIGLILLGEQMNFRPVSCPRQSFASAPRTKIGTRKRRAGACSRIRPNRNRPQRRPSPRFQPPSEPRARPGDPENARRVESRRASGLRGKCFSRVAPAAAPTSRPAPGPAASTGACSQERAIGGRRAQPVRALALAGVAALDTSSEPSALYFRPSVLRT